MKGLPGRRFVRRGDELLPTRSCFLQRACVIASDVFSVPREHACSLQLSRAIKFIKMYKSDVVLAAKCINFHVNYQNVNVALK